MAMTVTSLDNLRYKSNITSIRLINKVVEKFCAALTQHLRETVEDCMLCDQWGEYCEYSFPSLFITPVVGEWQEGEGQLLSFVTPHLDKFQAVKKKKKNCITSASKPWMYSLWQGRRSRVLWLRRFWQLAVPVQAAPGQQTSSGGLCMGQ